MSRELREGQPLIRGDTVDPGKVAAVHTVGVAGCLLRRMGASGQALNYTHAEGCWHIFKNSALYLKIRTHK